jgi:competence protein ComEA
MKVSIDKLFWTRWQAALVMAVVALALVFSQGTSLAAAKKSLVDINTASLAELEAVKGVGPATAKKIIAARPFKSVDDLSTVKGLSKAKVEALKDKVTVGQEKTATPEAKPARVPAPAASPAAEKAAVAKEPAPAKPAATEREKGGAAQLAPGQNVNLHTASKEDLDKLPEIGPVKAQAIIEGRPYTKIEDVMKVKGIKEGIFEKIKDHITVD